MSRHIQDPRAFIESRYLPDPRPLNSRTIPTDPYAGDRYLTEHQMPNGRIVSTDPASYSYSTPNSDGWHGQRPFEGSLPYGGEYRPQYLDSLTLPPIRGNPQPTTSLGDRDTGRSVQNTHHFNRPEERASKRHAPTAYGFRELRSSEGRASKRHAPTAYGFREIRGSEGRGSGKSGGGDRSLARNKDFGDLFADSSLHKGIPRTDAFHTSTSDKIEQPPPKYHGYHGYSEQEQNKMIECIKARMTWRQISKELGRSLGSVKTHWYKFLVKDPRAKGVKYALKYDL